MHEQTQLQPICMLWIYQIVEYILYQLSFSALKAVASKKESLCKHFGFVFISNYSENEIFTSSSNWLHETCKFSNAYFSYFTKVNPQIDFEHDYMTCTEAHDYAEGG